MSGPRLRGLNAGSIVLPAGAAVVTAALLLPLVYLVVRAVSGGSGALAVLDAATGRIVVDTVVLVVCVCAASLAIGVPLAWLLTSTDLSFRRAWTVAAVLPLVLPSYVASLALLGVLGPRGLVQQALEPLGVDRLPEIYGLGGATAALTLSTYPYVLLLAMAGFRTLDPSLVEAARSLGASRVRVARTVVLPSLRPSLVAGTLLVALYTLADFGAVALMQYPSLTRAVFLQYTAAFDRSAAATLGLVLFALSSIVLLADALVRSKARYARCGPGAGRRRRTVPLGRWRPAAAAFLVAVVGFFLLLPLGVLTWWTVDGIRLGEPLSIAWDAALATLEVSAAAAAVAVAAAFPVALYARRRPSLRSRTLERACFSASALPGIVVALALVFFGARYGGALYQSVGLLVFAYVVRFQPEALAGVSASLATIGTRLEEAARGLGHGALGSFLRITARLALPGVLGGGALVLLSAMKELPATLLLKPIGFETLATRIWSATSIDRYSEAAPAALLLVLLSAPIVWGLVARRALDP